MSKIEDLKTNVFTDEGRLLQTEFAVKNVSKAGTIIGMSCSDGVVLIGINKIVSDGIQKIYKLSDNTFCAVAGLFGDANRLIKFARMKAVSIQSTYGAPISPYVLCKFISSEKQWHTQNESTRPFGVVLIYGGIEENGTFSLHSTDPSGTINRWKAFSAGEDSEKINANLISDLPDSSSTMDEGIEQLVKIFVKSREISEDIFERLEILKFSDKITKFLSKDEIKSIIVRNNLLK